MKKSEKSMSETIKIVKQYEEILNAEKTTENIEKLQKLILFYGIPRFLVRLFNLNLYLMLILTNFYYELIFKL